MERTWKFVNQARADLITTENQMEGDNKEQRRTPLQLTAINMPFSVKISYIYPFHTLKYSFASLKQVNVERVEVWSVEDIYLELPGLCYILP